MPQDHTERNYGWHGMSLQAHEEIVVKLTKIEVGQEHLCAGLAALNKAVAKISVQEERQTTMQVKLDAACIKIEGLKSAYDRCPISNLKTQVGWIWVFLSSLGVGLALLFFKSLVMTI